MLALKTVLASADSIPVLIFDEIDVNIGGETALIVGQELKKLGDSHQVLCISHLPQVAACADTHYKVEKSVSKGRTFTEITEMTGPSRKTEIARMLGGGTAASKHAGEMLKESE
jgi:DNA repair protein RecN (Recombination protein N)